MLRWMEPDSKASLTIESLQRRTAQFRPKILDETSVNLQRAGLQGSENCRFTPIRRDETVYHLHSTTTLCTFVLTSDFYSWIYHLFILNMNVDNVLKLFCLWSELGFKCNGGKPNTVHKTNAMHYITQL